MTVKVFYRPEQAATVNDSFSPSAGKPAQVVASWQALGLDIELVSFEPASLNEICLAHSAEHVSGIMSLNKLNGFDNCLAEVRDSLPYSVGSFVAASLHAAQTGEVTCSPTSGFHHAGYAYGGAFCTFNGLMVAAIKLHHMGVERIGILDLDAHYGDGTDDIIRKLGVANVDHYSFGQRFIFDDDAEEWLDGLDTDLGQRFSECDVLLYQAGADPHVDDPLGGQLTTEQMRRRDRIVFEHCKRQRLPVCWNLAGGYQEPLRKVLDLHDTTMIECLEVYRTAG